MYLVVDVDYEFLVVGSGPTASAVLGPLLNSGKTVGVIDSAQSPSEGLQTYLYQLASRPWKDWTPETREQLLAKSAHGVSPKSYFGENFPYDSGILGIEYSKSDTRASVALGGFSTVWGATVLPFPRGVWPEPIRDVYEQLLPSLEDLSAAIGIAGEKGPVDLVYPGSQFSYSLPSTSAFTSLVRSESFLDERRDASISALSLPRLAVSERSLPNEPSLGCTNCGLCQVGCPYGHIWSSNKLVRQLNLTRGSITHRGVVKTIVTPSKSDFSRVIFEQNKGRNLEEITARHVLLATGPISTAAILLRSGIISGSVELQDSQTFFIGGLSQKDLFQTEHSTTLTEAISLAPALRPHTISHMQIYGPSAYLSHRVASSSKMFSILPRRLRNLTTRHIYIGLGYLPSAESGALSVNLVQDNRVKIAPSRRPQATAIRFAIKSHNTNLRRIGIRLIPPTVQTLHLGGGNHLGASIPMVGGGTRIIQNRHWSDELGRPFGTGNVHVVDSSILPSIPAGPITLTAMANANRIARRLAGT